MRRLTYHQQTGGHNWKRLYLFLERPRSVRFSSLSPEAANPFVEGKESCDHSARVVSSQSVPQHQFIQQTSRAFLSDTFAEDPRFKGHLLVHEP